MNATHTDFSLARNWLLQMGKGAALANVTVQYCMTLPREVLQSSEIAAVKRLRSPSNTKYQYFWLNFLTFIRCIFTTNLLPHSLTHSSLPSLTYSLSPVTIELINLWLASFFFKGKRWLYSLEGQLEDWYHFPHGVESRTGALQKCILEQQI